MYETKEAALAAAAPLTLTLDWAALWDKYGKIVVSALISLLLALEPKPMEHHDGGKTDCCACIARLACALKCMGHAQEHIAAELLAHLEGCCNK